MPALLELPINQRFVYDDEPKDAGSRVEFRLIYDGRLFAQKKSDSRRDHKHEIRQRFHKQLSELWKQHPGLVRFAGFGGKEEIAPHFQLFGFNFIPLVNQKVGGSFATLDILFLRRDHPGNLINERSDIDNRIKVVFDALKVPKYSSDLAPGTAPQEGEDPFYCLLEDDSLITSVNITTDRLLTPFEGEPTDHPLNDTVLVITVKTGIFYWRNHSETFM